MFRHFGKSLYMCVVLMIASLASLTASLSLEDLSLEMRQLKQNNDMLTARVVRMEELNYLNRLKIQLLESTVTELKERQTLYNAVRSVIQGSTSLLSKRADQRNALFRTCKEIYQADPLSSSGMYWIDPDGRGVGDDPIYVECDMTTGKTSVLHDSEDPTNVGHCPDPGCYTRSIKYSASTRQMKALAELSIECHQSITYECNYAPLETNGVAQSWWNDRNGVAQYFWSGSNNSIHICQCGIDHNCIESYYLCNCDSAVPVLLNDSGIITDKSYLPITQLNFGRTQFESSSGVHTLGRFECTGQTTVTGVPKSCSDLWKMGHILSGLYSIKGENQVEMVHCDFMKLPNELGFQNWIGLVDVTTSPVYFHVMRNITNFYTLHTPVTFDTEIFSTGGAMNMSSGIFTAPQKGQYFFVFSSVAYFGANQSGMLSVEFYLNGRAVNYGHAHGTVDNQSSVHTTLQLQVGDQVWTEIVYVTSPECTVQVRLSYFTGSLLKQEIIF